MTNNLPPMPDTPPMPAEPPAEPAPAAKRRLSPLAAGLIGLATGAAIVGGAWAATGISSGPGTFTLTGSFALTDSVIDDTSTDCRGSDGYDDIAEGTSVTVYNAAGDVVATGSLGDSTRGDDYGPCTFKVAVDGVPKGEKFYKVEVSHRGTVQLAADEAENGKFAASLG
jgi:hypothetical protein